MNSSQVVTDNIFNEAFKETMDAMNVKGKALAELTGRSYNNISRIRQGKDNPSLKDFCGLLNAAESLVPGFYTLFLQNLIVESKVSSETLYKDAEIQISNLSVQSKKKLMLEIVDSLAHEIKPELVAS